MLFFEVWKGIPIDCAKYKNNSQTFWWNFPILFPNFRAQCSGTVVSENSQKENPCVVFVVDICPAVLWLLFRFPTLNTMGVLYYTYYLFIDRGQKCHHWDYFFCGGLWVSQPDALAGSSPPRLGLWLSPWKEIFLPLPKFNICGGPQ